MNEAQRSERRVDRLVGRQPRRQVLHKQIYRRNAFGGTTNTTLCGRVKLGAEGANSADTDAEVTCKFCLHKMHLPLGRRRINWHLGTEKPRAKGFYAVQDLAMRCGCCWINVHWNGREWHSDLYTPGRFRTLMRASDIARWREIDAPPNYGSTPK